MMPKNIKIDWSNSDEIDGKYFTEDKLDRAKYAEFLTRYLVSQGFDDTRPMNEQKKNYVINLNSGWGTGKTYFLKRWKKDLQENYPVVYVDAWKKDYSDDPLMTVISAVITSLKVQAGNKGHEFKAPAKLLGLLKAAAPGIARGMSKKYLDFDILDFLTSDEVSESSSKNDESNGADLSFAASEAVNYLLKEHEGKSKAIDALKSSISNWLDKVTKSKKLSFPAFVLIDELDRCRPSYAIEMLETIKHIFDIPGVVFVVATDTEQLQHVVKSVYGLGFDARVYLGRFFDSRFSLKSPNLSRFLDVHCDSNVFSEEHLEKNSLTLLPYNKKNEFTLENISIVLDAFQVSARTAIQIAERVIATVEHMPSGSGIDILMLTTLHCIKEKDNELFDEIILCNFKRLDDNGKEISLDDYLISLVSPRDTSAKMEFDPKKVTVNFSVSNVRQPRNNDYPEGLYFFSFIDYLKDIFSTFFSNGSSALGGFVDFYGHKLHNEQTQLQKAAEKLCTYKNKLGYGDNIKNGESAILWFKYIYQSDPFIKIRPSFYHDLIELSSALDWVGEDAIEP